MATLWTVAWPLIKEPGCLSVQSSGPEGQASTCLPARGSATSVSWVPALGCSMAGPFHSQTDTIALTQGLADPVICSLVVSCVPAFLCSVLCHQGRDPKTCISQTPSSGLPAGFWEEEALAGKEGGRKKQILPSTLWSLVGVSSSVNSTSDISG